MYGKIFEQIYDSSIAEDWTVRTVFQDMIVLSDINGVVDRTPESISRRTNVPLEIVTRAIKVLEAPDPRSRSKLDNGARLRRLDPDRDWGWEIVNYEIYRRIASDEQRRENTKLRTRKWRDSKGLQTCDAPVTQCDAGDAMQKQRKKHIQKESTVHTPVPISVQKDVLGASPPAIGNGRQQQGSLLTVNSFQRPTLAMIKLQGAKIGLPDEECEIFYHHFESNGWKVSGKTPMKSWTSAMFTWLKRWQARIRTTLNGHVRIPKPALPDIPDDCMPEIR